MIKPAQDDCRDNDTGFTGTIRSPDRDSDPLVLRTEIGSLGDLSLPGVEAGV